MQIFEDRSDAGCRIVYVSFAEVLNDTPLRLNGLAASSWM